MRASDVPAPRLEALVVPGIERAVGHVRRWLSDVLGPDHPGLYDCSVCVSELMTNALRHTDSGLGGSIRVELVIGRERVRGEVTDDGGAESVPRVLDAGDGVRGRGLRIVEAYSLAWGVRRRGHGFTVWFVLDAR
ncbi:MULTISPECIES: ATP-binding protein [Actinomadura]|uniref:Histidine kinase/HSP90-like ATPase domain-containing protein n=1 Tax=Actinomadura miaoliensis TaxID=430685 RepID=A0ABP7V9K6_9ACTN